VVSRKRKYKSTENENEPEHRAEQAYAANGTSHDLVTQPRAGNKAKGLRTLFNSCSSTQPYATPFTILTHVTNLPLKLRWKIQGFAAKNDKSMLIMTKPPPLLTYKLRFSLLRSRGPQVPPLSLLHACHVSRKECTFHDPTPRSKNQVPVCRRKSCSVPLSAEQRCIKKLWLGMVDVDRVREPIRK
jgi:hypothetical protein